MTLLSVLTQGDPALSGHESMLGGLLERGGGDSHTLRVVVMSALSGIAVPEHSFCLLSS